MIDRVVKSFKNRMNTVLSFFTGNKQPNLEELLDSNELIFDFQKTNKDYLLNINQSKPVLIRGEGHSDYAVFKQVFNDKEYEFVKNYFCINDQYENLVVFDLGANIGLTTFYFNSYFKNTTFFAVEPGIENFKLLKENTSNLANKVHLFQNAIAHETGLNFGISNGFRDGKDWSITTEENSEGSIQGITIQEIIDAHFIEKIDLLKIDIEGAERFLFSKKTDYSYLARVHVIAIEIHDEFNCRSQIMTILREMNFILFEIGETTVGLNKNCI